MVLHCGVGGEASAWSRTQLCAVAFAMRAMGKGVAVQEQKEL